MMTFIFPILMMLMSISAAAVYACDGDWRRTAYWAAATVITAAVTL